MAKKNTVPKTDASTSGVNNKNQNLQQQVAKGNTTASKPLVAAQYLNLLYAGGIALITFLFFKVCLENKFVSWDDPGYVTENPLVKNLAGGLRDIFTQPVMGNYHPLTILSLAIEYSFVQLEPWLYHLDSVLLHIIVSVFVYWLVVLLTRRPLAAAITALLFALHPMHVESVAWVSGRKDVLYGSFYVAALITYVYYLRREAGSKWLFYAATLLLFVLALLAKPVAVVLPVTLLLLDYLESRKMSAAAWIEKIPFFLVALGFGIKSVKDQSALGVVSKLNDHFNIIDTLTMGCYTFGSYIWKALLPVGLSCFYPYPAKVNNLFPAGYYVYPFAVVALLFVIWKWGRQHRNVLFGFLFFVCNIALLLQFVPVGNAIIAERYSYIPYLGLFFIAGTFIANIMETKTDSAMKRLLPPGMLVLCLLFGFMSNARCKVWYDGATLWADQKEKHPDNEYAYNSLGFDFFTRWKTAGSAEEERMCYDSAQYYLNAALKINPDYVYPYISLGIMARVMGRVDEARFDFHKAATLANGAERPTAYLGLGILYFLTKQVDSSYYYLKESVRLKPDLQPAHANLANLLDMTNRTDEAMDEYNLSIKLAPGSFESYLNRGRVLLRINRNEEAFNDFNKALELNPQSGESFYARALYYGKVGNKQLAMKDVEMAATYGFKQVDRAFFESISK